MVIYDVSEAELEILERGSPASLFLNFALTLLSAAVTFIIALVTTDVKSGRTFIVFVVAAIVGLLGGTLLLLLWWRDHTSISKIVDRIRRRLPAEGVQVTDQHAGI